MSIQRAIDSNNDWTFGYSLNNYVSDTAEVAQDIKTRLQCWLGDCFFDAGSGLNWTVLLSSKDRKGFELSISTVILNTPNVQSLTQLYSVLDTTQRRISISYSVVTIYGTTVNNEIIIPTSETGF